LREESLNDHSQTINPEDIGAQEEEVKDLRDRDVSVVSKIAQCGDRGKETIGTGFIGNRNVKLIPCCAEEEAQGHMVEWAE
jgi:hypothetical protein